MSLTACPVCEHKNPAAAMRCTRCGANFSDPDVMALAGGGALASESLSSIGETGALSSDRFFGFSLSDVAAGDLARLGLGGAALLAVGFLLPAAHGLDETRAAWSAASDGDAAALFFPLLAAAAGILAALARGLPAALRLGLLAGAGLAGLAWALPALGEMASTATPAVSLINLAIAAGGAALVFRATRPAHPDARAVLAAAAALLVVASLIPLWDPARLLPFEIWPYLEGDGGARSYLATFAGVANRDPLVFFTVLHGLAPVALLVGAAALGWGRASGPWDKRGLVLRPIAAFFAVYFVLGFALYIFNLMGWAGGSWVAIDGEYARFEGFASSRKMVRVKLMVLSLPLMLWAQLGLAALWDRLRPAGGAEGA